MMTSIVLKYFPFFFLSVRKLLEKGVNPDTSNEDGLTALHQVKTRLVNALFKGYY